MQKILPKPFPSRGEGVKKFKYGWGKPFLLSRGQKNSLAKMTAGVAGFAKGPPPGRGINLPGGLRSSGGGLQREKAKRFWVR
ncbi:MAG: hypothetical protein AMJ94_06305 [Deltaproteobacteria bacterium SM23_61]|nr:MAG: hypothetical protein AMJ94_06305 [Deltaproteobacteria bacterium SM23_61]